MMMPARRIGVKTSTVMTPAIKSAMMRRIRIRHARTMRCYVSSMVMVMMTMVMGWLMMRKASPIVGLSRILVRSALRSLIKQ